MVMLHLFLCFCFYQAIPIFAQHTTTKCLPNRRALINLENQYELKISELDYSISYDRLDVLGEASTPNATEIRLESADVIITGRIYIKENDKVSKIARNFTTKSVVVRVSGEKLGSQRKQISCKVVDSEYLSKGETQPNTSLKPQDRIDFVVRGLIENCLEIQVCEQYKAVISNVSSIVKDYYEETVENVPRRSKVHQKSRQEKAEHAKNLQNTINSMFDFGLSVGISKLVDCHGIYHIPDVSTNYTAAGSTGDFYGSNGTFVGFASLRRVKDMVFSHNKKCYTMGTTLRLSTAKVTIPSYHGRYGYVNIYGHVVLDIKGISLTMKVSVDYNVSPCKVNLDEMIIHDVGHIDVDITGLGWPLNSILEPVIRRIIRTTVFEKAKEAVAQETSQLDCEKFRPTIELMGN